VKTATDEVQRAMSDSPDDLPRVLAVIADRAAGLIDCAMVNLWRRAAGCLEQFAVDGDDRTERVCGAESVPLIPGSVLGRSVLDCRTVHSPDLATAFEAEYPFSVACYREHGHRTVLAVPIRHSGQAIGAIVAFRYEWRPFAPVQVSILEGLAAQATFAIENARLAAELQERLAEQTATAAVLRAISESPTDVRPVIDAIVENAMRVCDADDVIVRRVEGDEVVRVAARGPIAGGALLRPERARLQSDVITDRAVLERRSVQVDDINGPAGDEFPMARENARRTGVRTYLATPMLVGGIAVGVILLRRREVRPFNDRQIRLLEGFASQAAIAMENGRLFTELQTRLEEQTASGRVLRVMAESPTDPQRALDTIVETAARLCDSEEVAVLLVDADHVRAVALSGAGSVRRTLDHPGAPRKPPDPMDPTRLSVPLLVEEATVGFLVLIRHAARPFGERIVAVARVLADQAVIAIENGGLYAHRREPPAASPLGGRAGPIVEPTRAPTPDTVTAGPASNRMLTTREQEVAALVAVGSTNRQIAEELVIAEPTAERHVANIMGKLGFHARAQVAAWYARNGRAAALKR
jgi:GAF domain-containing protein/DNA-binding CsgD family transcriptional regulator